MIDHIWSILCSRSVVDRDSNNISIQNVLENITIGSEPIEGGRLPINLELVSFWCRTDPNLGEGGQARINLISPSGKTDKLITYPIDLVEKERLRTRITINYPTFSESGRYVFEVSMKIKPKNKWKVVSRVPLDINFKTLEGGTNEQEKTTST